jgi:hypothetical protein
MLLVNFTSRLKKIQNKDSEVGNLVVSTGRRSAKGRQRDLRFPFILNL